MLSKDAIKLLKWFEKRDRWINLSEIKESYKNFDDRDLKTLKTENMIDAQLSINGKDWIDYRISSYGKAYLQKLRSNRFPKLMEWVNALIGLTTFISGVLLSDSIKKLIDLVKCLFT